MAHLHELIDFTASAFIVHEGRVLLLHHKKLHAWIQIGGHIELHETPDEALLREIQEECGLEVEVLAERTRLTASEHVQPLWRPDFMNVHQYNATHRHVDFGYVCRAKTSQFVLQEDEATDMAWFDADQLNMLDTLQNVRELALLALDIAAKAG